MTTAAAKRLDPRADPVAAFALRCQARALLLRHGVIELQDAIDGLQYDAYLDGLVDDIGQDNVQAILAAAFGGTR